MSSTRSRGALNNGVLALAFAGVAMSGCEGGSSTGSTDGGGIDKEQSCLMQATLSGGVNASLGNVNQACAYSELSVAFVGLGESTSITMVVQDVERGQTGSFPATIAVRSDTDRWSGATCTVAIETNVKVESTVDAGAVDFDMYRLQGTGTCSTPANYISDGGAKEPVTIAPFTFVFTTLFY